MVTYRIVQVTLNQVFYMIIKSIKLQYLPIYSFRKRQTLVCRILVHFFLWNSSHPPSEPIADRTNCQCGLMQILVESNSWHIRTLPTDSRFCVPHFSHVDTRSDVGGVISSLQKESARAKIARKHPREVTIIFDKRYIFSLSGIRGVKLRERLRRSTLVSVIIFCFFFLRAVRELLGWVCDRNFYSQSVSHFCSLGVINNGENYHQAESCDAYRWIFSSISRSHWN